MSSAQRTAKTNARKTEVLGMPLGTANNRLKKMLLLRLIQRLGDDDCFRCGKKITTPAELTLDHKLAWINEGAAVYWDLDNIAFSHHACNSGAASRVRNHSAKGYERRGCRCAVCREAHRAATAKWRARRKLRAA